MIDLSRYQVVLGSTSERRLQILSDVLKINCEVIKPDFEENLSKCLPPRDYVYGTSKGKIDAIIRDNTFEKPTIVICCDTIIDWNGNILEKPITKSKQLEMFENYKTNPHLHVLSSIQVARVDKEVEIVSEVVETKLTFDSGLSQDVVQSYIESEEGLNVAGGFKYQESGNILFNSLQGDYFNVVGLPAKVTFKLIHDLVV
ncbi:dTTP/UTP pyrophosphatase [[Candida] jaroonii]|uniref:dTTP/UTP pyrophosphatase n=1 Tax=[Candida] jaroonii TaxID=467808 RepID=A0ACA9YBD2_9ASCO|nr:dTTP/UTP pyrophosphatase [[Candida] jaroonii]